MNQKSIVIAIILAFCFLNTGCASILTYMSPLQSKLVTDTSVRSNPGFHYACKLRESVVYVTKSPYCPETAKTCRHAKKSSGMGLPIAMGEVVLYGLGLVDMLSMYAISEDSKVEYLLGDYDTGVSLPCGKVEIAAGENMVIENDSHTIYHETRTDGFGRIDLAPILSSAQDKREFRIYLKSDPNVSFSLVYK